MLRTVSVVTPSYNDAQTLLPVLRKLENLLKRSKRDYEIVVIDDESHDSAVERLKHYARNHPCLRVFYHKKNQGIAKTYRELYRRARYPIIVLFSLDGEWDPTDVLRLTKKLEDEKLDIVIGWRRIKAYRWGRKVVSTLYNHFVRLLFGVPSFDAGSIKAMQKKVTEIPIMSVGVFDEAERIIRAHRMGYRIGVLPVSHKSSSTKRRFIPRLGLITQAVIDMMRVWWSLI